MTKKIAGLDALFQNIDPYAAGPSRPANRAPGYLPLDQIRPDPTQPRRVLPDDLAAQFATHPDAPAMLAAWQQHRDVAAAAAYAELESLANSIAADGLINPISVTPDGNSYKIISGERRWWAHQLLRVQGRSPQGGQAGQIEALIRTAENSAVKQLAENLQRQDLSAVEVALGLAQLIAQLEGSSVPIGTLAGGPPAQARLAALRAVATRRLREGTWEQVIERLGKSRPVWARHLALLRLPDEAMLLALNHRLPEGALRAAVAAATPEQQLALVKAIVRQRLAEAEGSDAQQAALQPAASQAEAHDPARFRRQFARGLHQFAKTLDGAKVAPRTLARQLAQDQDFADLAQTARRLLPLLQAIVEAGEK